MHATSIEEEVKLGKCPYKPVEMLSKLYNAPTYEQTVEGRCAVGILLC